MKSAFKLLILFNSAIGLVACSGFEANLNGETSSLQGDFESSSLDSQESGPSKSPTGFLMSDIDLFPKEDSGSADSKSEPKNTNSTNRGMEFAGTFVVRAESLGDGNWAYSCFTSRDLEGVRQGLWDKGEYTSCNKYATPLCAFNSKLIKVSEHRGVNETNGLPTRTTNYACVIPSSETPSSIVATAFSRESKTGQRICVAGSRPEGSGRDLYDLASYSSCNNGQVKCGEGSHKVVLSQAELSEREGGVESNVICVKNEGRYLGVRFVASMDTVESSSQSISCKALEAKEDKFAGRFDEGEYAFCRSGNTPVCRNGSKKIIVSQLLQPDGSMKYHHACILPISDNPNRIVAKFDNRFSKTYDGVNQPFKWVGYCFAPTEIQKRNYFDFGEHAYCLKGRARCNWSQRILINQSMFNSASIMQENLCVE